MLNLMQHNKKTKKCEEDHMCKKRGFFLTAVLGIFLVLPLMAQARSATPIDSWAQTNSFVNNTAIVLNAVTDDRAGTYVAVGNLGVTLTSTDGENWSLRIPSAGNNRNLLGVAYGSTGSFTGFIAVGDSRTISKSTDGGQSWAVLQPNGITGNLKAITFGDGLFVAVGDGGGVFTYDGNLTNTWTRQAMRTSPTTAYLTSATLLSVIYAPSQHRFTAVGVSGVILASYDGFYWEKEAIPAGGTLQGIAFGQTGVGTVNPIDLYVAVNSTGTIFVSADGFTSWTPFKTTQIGILAGNLRGITFAGGTFLVVGSKGYIYRLDEELGWVAMTVPTKPGTNPAVAMVTNIRAVGSDATRFYAVGELGTILTTKDVKLWPYQSTSNPTGRLSAAAFGNGRFVTAGQYGNIFTSTDGIGWLESRLTKFDNTFPYIESITYGNGLFVAVGDADSQDTVTPIPAIFTSPDGLTWTQRSTDTLAFGGNFTNQDMYGVAFGSVGGSPGYVAVGSAGTIITSTSADGSVWTLRNTPTTNNLNGIAFGAGTFVAVGDKGTILYSTDGTLWNQATIGVTTPYFQAVTFGNGLFVAVASNGVVYYATNPTGTWIKSATTIAGSLGVTYGAGGGFPGGFVAVGYAGAVWESPDAISWTKVSTGVVVAGGLEAIAFGNNTFVATGAGSFIITRTLH